MKKFTFMLLAAFIAVTAMATGLEKRQALNLNSVATTSVKQVTPKAKAAKVQMSAVENLKKVTNKAKANVRKAPKKAGIADLMSVDWMLCSYYYEYDSEAGSLVASTPAAGGTPVSFSMLDEQTIAINGFTSDATEAIQGTVAVTTDEELLAEGVIAEISIADGQTLLESDYGPIILTNCSAANEGDPIVAYVYSDGYVGIDNLWAAFIGGDGDYAGYLWTDYCSSFAIPVNGKMAWGEGDDAKEYPVYIYQDAKDPKTVTVYNFGGEGTAVDVSVKEDKTFVIDEQVIGYGGDTAGYLYVSGLLISGGSYYLANLTGQGTETALTFDVSWIYYSPTTMGIYGLFDPATITFIDGSEFAYPEIPDVAAMPADPSVVYVSEYDASDGYGYVAADIPVTDVDGNDLKESKLYYVLYSDIEGEIAPITFTPDLYIKLEADLTEIPYSFSDSYDFQTQNGYKYVFLNYDYTDYNRIGVQSVYTGGDEINATEIQWYKIKDYTITTGDFTFDFNALGTDEEPWPTSSSLEGDNDGDITETCELIEGNVTLAIAPKTESAANPNRFWQTNAGPQLRMYSSTMTFTVPTGYVITGIEFYHNGYWGGKNSAGNVSVDPGTITNNATDKVATWAPAEGTEGAQTVVVTIGANTQINKITVTVEKAPEVDITVTISDALYATYVAPVDVDFTGAEVSAFAVTVNGEYAHLEPVTTVPAGTAVVVKAAEAGTYKVALTTDATLGTTNELVAATEDVTADGTQYVLAKVDDVVGFYKATGTIAAGKGYLVVSSPVKGFYGFEEDDATAISRIAADENAIIYNLAGQRVSKAVKGINIINGKKVLK